MSKNISSSTINKREAEMKDNGWGYRNSFFYLNDNNEVNFTDDGRYDISNKELPFLKLWMIENMGIDLNFKTPAQASIQYDSSTEVKNDNFIAFLEQFKLLYSLDTRVRINRAHGHTLQDLFILRHGKVARIPDVVVWPRCHDEVIRIVSAANSFNIAIIPFGGGTSVTTALACPSDEKRMIVSLDMCKMNKVLWIDQQNYLARAEAGIVGVDLERQLNAEGFTMGHEPDSVEFSTLGGWIATRASGMKKNKYGNIEDLVIHISTVSPTGVVQKSCQVPRISSGPDIHHFILGSEGTLGVITEATFKIFPVPECKRYGSIVFPNFEAGVNCMREIARRKCAPTSVRLVDNEQFMFGQALKPATASFWKWISDKFKKFYLLNWKGFNAHDICVMTLVFEGSLEEVDAQEKNICFIASQFGGLPAGAENGRYGYMLTFAIAYLRDLGFEYGIMGESFETSVPWDRVLMLCHNLKQLLHEESKRRGVIYPVYASCRVTQVYDSGACVYFYYAFNYRGMTNALEIYEEIEEKARDEILACGGSISHHHGVGKLRQKWLPHVVGEIGVSAMKAVKQTLDPNNIFANGNLFAVSKL